MEDDTAPAPPRSRPPTRLLVAGTAFSLLVALLVANALVGDSDESADDVIDVSDLIEGDASGDVREPGSVDPADVEVGDPFPTGSWDWLDEGTGSIADFADTPVLVNFFSRTCVPCITEMPELERISASYAGEVTVVGLAVTDSPDAAADILAETGVTYRAGRDPSSEFLHGSGGASLPHTVLVDSDGTILRMISGAQSEDELAAILDEELPS